MGVLVKIKGVHRVRRRLADGTVRTHYYAWRGGPVMTAAPHTEAFAKEWLAHKAAAESVPDDTLATLIDRFTGPERQRNSDFAALADSTQRDHLYAFSLIKAHWPDLPLKLTQQKGMKADIRKWHRSFAANPRKADKLLFSLSKVFSYAIADEHIEKNPCHGIERLYDGSRRDTVWTPELLSRFRSGAKAHLLLAFEIAAGTGQRQGDILALAWRDYDGDYLRFEQSKGGKRLKVKVHDRLKSMIDAQPKDALRICMNSRGRPWTKDGFRTSWAEACAKLGIKGVTFHDLRGTFITERVAEGSSVEHVAQISGHSTSEVRTVLEKHYLAADQSSSDAVILRMERKHKL